MGGRFKRERTLNMQVVDSYCFMAEASTILESDYPLNKNKRENII